MATMWTLFLKTLCTLLQFWNIGAAFETYLVLMVALNPTSSPSRIATAASVPQPFNQSISRVKRQVGDPCNPGYFRDYGGGCRKCSLLCNSEYGSNFEECQEKCSGHGLSTPSPSVPSTHSTLTSTPTSTLISTQTSTPTSTLISTLTSTPTSTSTSDVSALASASAQVNDRALITIVAVVLVLFVVILAIIFRDTITRPFINACRRLKYPVQASEDSQRGEEVKEIETEKVPNGKASETSSLFTQHNKAAETLSQDNNIPNVHSRVHLI